MITIHYFDRGDYREREFESLEKAVRFCWAMKYHPERILSGWSTWWDDENRELERRVNVYAINHRKEVKKGK